MSQLPASTDFFLPLVIVFGATLAGGLVLLQSDRVSRRILNSSKLDAKRRGEYRYSWKNAIEKTKLQLDYYFAGGIETYKEDPECVMKSTEFVSKEEDMNDLIHRILIKKNRESKFYTLKIDKDPHDPTGDYFLFLVEEKMDEKSAVVKLYEVPLVKFGLKLAQAFEDQLTTTTLCFVADASSGKASKMLELLVKEAKTGVVVLSEPFWMIQLAGLMDAAVLTSSKIQKLFFALCRLDAWSLRDEIAKGDAKTVLITLPGQATVATLLPLSQKVFPEDRHLFAYDGCVSSVKKGMYAQSQYRRGKLETQLASIINGICQDPIRYTTPFPSNSPLTKDASLRTLADAFSNIPLTQGQVVETWMSSVDAYFKLKQEETKNGYLPFCFKLGFLTSPVGNFEQGSDSFWSLTALLQFVTGCRSRALPEGVVDAAKEWLKDYNQIQSDEQKRIDKYVNISEHDRKMIENCVFQHKLILIGNKTLQDTVLPKEHWTLKQASRAGCSCCGPDPYDMEQEEEDAAEERTNDRATSNGIDMNSPGAFAMAFKTDGMTASNSNKNIGAPSNSGYVDGKLGFAFDPTRF
jgi:hypothetical protein